MFWLQINTNLSETSIRCSACKPGTCTTKLTERKNRKLLLLQLCLFVALILWLNQEDVPPSAETQGRPLPWQLVVFPLQDSLPELCCQSWWLFRVNDGPVLGKPSSCTPQWHSGSKPSTPAFLLPLNRLSSILTNVLKDFFQGQANTSSLFILFLQTVLCSPQGRHHQILSSTQLPSLLSKQSEVSLLFPELLRFSFWSCALTHTGSLLPDLCLWDHAASILLVRAQLSFLIFVC